MRTKKPRSRKKKKNNKKQTINAVLKRIPLAAALQGIIPIIALVLFGTAAVIAKALPIQEPVLKKNQDRIVEDVVSPPIVPGTVKTVSFRRPLNESIDTIQLASLVPVDREEPRLPPIKIPDEDVEIELPPIPRERIDDPLTALAQAREYLVVTAKPGGTMTRQGPEKALACFHPEFALRLAAAIREARVRGLPTVGVFSACRPPAFGVGGFRDKFNSLHAYGLAADMFGIGRPGSRDAKHWHSIARRHGVVCPYGPNNRAEFNHCQPTSLKIVTRSHPLRKTITAKGPVDLEKMWGAAKAIIVSVAAAAASQVAEPPKAKKKTRTVKRTKKRQRVAKAAEKSW